MHVHILGICGTFMGGLAAIAKAAGHRVTGSDKNVYPPMSTQLEALGIELISGFEAGQLASKPDIVVVGNVMTRGAPVIEALLESRIPYTSGPEWLAREVLRDVHVLGVSGTHGKTTTSSMLAWILEHAGLNPGFLIGGVPGNFSVSARLGGRKYFVIEADEYDTAFFDKRAKFVHYRPRTLVLNNLEFDHADIYENLGAIQKQFHHLVRTIPGSGRILWNAGDDNLKATLAMGAWTPLEGFARTPGAEAAWSLDVEEGGDYSKFVVLEGGKPAGTVKWSLLGAHNAENALAAIGAARHAGRFRGAVHRGARRIQGRETPHGVARRSARHRGVRRFRASPHGHRLDHRRPAAQGGQASASSPCSSRARPPCAWACIATRWRLRSRPRMRCGCSRRRISAGMPMPWWPRSVPRGGWRDRSMSWCSGLAGDAASGDQVLIMSNGGFGGLHGKLLEALARM